MSKRAFHKIAAGLREAAAVGRGERKPARLFIPPELDVRAIRTKLQLSQQDFAATFAFTVHQIRQWEQARSRPLGAERAYLMIIDRDPKRVLELLRRKAAA